MKCTHFAVFEPIPKSQVVINQILLSSGPCRLSRVSQSIVSGPYPFRAFSIQQSDAKDKVERKLLVPLLFMTWLMKLGYDRGYSDIGIEPQIGGPMRGHVCKYGLDPLASVIVADDHPKDVRELLDGCCSKGVNVGIAFGEQ